MSTTAELENAPVGATATAPNGSIALKTGRRAFEWSIFDSRGYHCDVHNSDEMVGYKLNPAAPTTAQEALDLAWDLAHPVKEGQTIPEGVRLLDRLDRNDLSAYTTRVDFIITARESLHIRTLDPLPAPEPDPDWLDAPAVMARLESWAPCAGPQVFTRHDWYDAPSEWRYNGTESVGWQELHDVTPLYRKGQEA